jgi:predicted O-linked N-acetylglucosamine transferase (SPINDLY family)
VVLLSPGTPFKYIPRHDWMLAEIAKRVERGRIVFFEPASPGIAQLLRRRLRKAFEARGVDFARRAAFAPWTDRAGFQGWLERADLYLDTVGFSGFNTPMQALDCGLPIVAREGRFARGRQASGMLRQMGLGELVAESDDAYVEIAAKLARDKDWRSGLKKRIRESSGPLFEDLAPIRAMEAFLAGGGKSP